MATYFSSGDGRRATKTRSITGNGWRVTGRLISSPEETFTCHYRQGGLTLEQFKIVLEWAKEYGVYARYEIHKIGEEGIERWHYHIGRIRHIFEK